MTTTSSCRDDSGFTLVEVVVAAVVLALMGAAVAGILVQSLNLTKDNAERVQAASVARSQLEAVRASDALALASGVSTPFTVTQQGTTYTVTQASSLVGSGAVTACDPSGDDLSYRRITVSVSWPGMGTTRPVRADTLLALTAAQRAAISSRGAVAASVQSYDGSTTTALEGATVTLGTQTQLTDENGCAVFDQLAPGDHPMTVGKAGYVDVSGRPTWTSPSAVVVTAGDVARPAKVLLGRPGALRVNLTAPSGFTPVPATGMPVTLDAAGWTPYTYRTYADCSVVATRPVGCVDGTPRTAAVLYPTTYQVSAGACGVAPPTSYVAVVPPGGTADVTVPLAPVTVSLSISVVGTAPITIGSPGRTGCTATSETVQVVTAGTRIALPAGTYTFTRPLIGTVLGVSRTVTVTAASTTAVVL